MNKSVRNRILTILCGAMVAAAGSCSAAQTYPVTVDGEQLRAGIYILNQQTSFNEATRKLSEEQPDLDTQAEGFSYLDQTVEGKTMRDWVNDEALEKCREYIAVLRLFDQYGLEMSADEMSDINSNVTSLWTEENQYAQYFYGVSIVGDYYAKLGVGEQSFKDMSIEDKKRDKLFDHLYGEGGELAATEEEINEALQKDYIALNYFPYELENGDSAQSFADRIAAGESYEEVYRDYAQALSDEEAAAAAAEAAAAKAEEEAAKAAGEDDDGSEDTIDDVETDGEENEDEDEAEDTAAADTEAPVIEVAEKDSLIQIIQKTSTSPSEEFVKQASEMNAGEVKVITVKEEDEDHEHVYVVQKLDILSVPEKTDTTVDTIRTELKTPEFEEMLKTTGSAYTLTTDSSINLYKLEKIIDT